MSGPKPSQLDEFGEIARLFRPLTRGAPEARGLLDDAAVIPGRAGHELVVTKDGMVAGVHFLPDDPPGIVARKLMRANLSDLAAKAAEPFGYFLMTAWSSDYTLADRSAFAEGLALDGAAFDVSLLGGDTVSTPGPMTLSMTMMGWAPLGATVPRAGARVGDLVMVSGPIGDGWLAWGAACGEIAGGWAPEAHRLPVPRLDLRAGLRAHASAAADVSDGLVADAGHIATASGVGMSLDLDRMPLSPAGSSWLAAQPDRAAALVRMATGGEDFEIVCTASPAAAAALGLPVIGEVTARPAMSVRVGGAPVETGPGGWRHV